jgi:hypothetical protein
VDSNGWCSDDATDAEVERLFAPRADHPARRAIESRGVVIDGSCLFVPVASPSHVYGCLALVDKIGAPEFSDVDTQLAATFGAQAGIVYENARLLGRLQAPSLYAKLRSLRVLFISGYTHYASFDSTIVERERAFLEKPFSAEGLIAKVREVLPH